MESVSLAQYAATLKSSNRKMTGELRARLKTLSTSLRDITRHRRCELARERADDQLEIARKRLALDRERLNLEREIFETKFPLVENPETVEEPPLALTPEEKAQMLKEIFNEDHQPNENQNPTGPCAAPSAE